jgi:hypothetical protein
MINDSGPLGRPSTPALPGMPPLGAGSTEKDRQEFLHRSPVLLPSDEPFHVDVDDDIVDPVLGNRTDHYR